LLIAGITLAIFSVALAMRQPEAPPAPELKASPAPEAIGPRYWKGNLHTHSLWSDGDDYPDMIADWYASHGYNFLTLSEHNVIAEGERWIDGMSAPLRKLATEKYRKRFGPSWVEERDEKGKTMVRLKPLREFRTLFDTPNKFVMIQGEEVTHAFKKQPLHMNAINLRDVLKPIEGQDMPESLRVNLRQIADQQKKAGWPGLTFLNHPNYKWGQTAEEIIPVEELRFFEVYNGHPAVANEGDATHASTERIWDIILAVRLGKLQLPMIYGVATDDAHYYHQIGIGKPNPGRGWVMVRAARLSPENIVRSMTAGDYYCSSGATLSDITQTVEELKLTIATEPGTTYKTEFIATLQGTSTDSKPVTDAEDKPLPVTQLYSDDIGKVVATSTDAKPSYKFTGKELYVRARVTSSKPHPNPYAKGDTEMAWTQPVQPKK